MGLGGRETGDAGAMAERVAHEIAGLLGDDLVGVYLHGSLAMQAPGVYGVLNGCRALAFVHGPGPRPRRKRPTGRSMRCRRRTGP